MIEKIIIQDPSEVHSIWIPERRSLASFLIWKAFGLGTGGQWADGQISLGTRREWADWPAFPEFPGYRDDSAIPGWVDRHLALVDAALPSAADILVALDADSLTVSLDPPAYRLPLSPGAEDLATCVLACRMLLSAKDYLIGPTDVPSEDLVSDLTHASRIATMLGGDLSRQVAVETARSNELCFIFPDVTDTDASIMKEDADD